jgi:CotS family spore coat protein
MDDEIIYPWGTADQDTMPVPPEVEAMAKRVITHYDMKVQDMQLVTSKPDKGGAIWRLSTNKGPRSLKLLHRRPSRSLFSIGAQAYLVQKGARVPALVRTKKGDQYVEAGCKLWIVTDWIEGLKQAAKVDLEGAEMLCYGLGEFHKHSKGYKPSRDAERVTRLTRWPDTYNKIITKMDWFRNLAKAYNEMPASPVLLSLIDMFEQQAKQSLSRLEKSPYQELVARGEEYWGIVHQDYGWSNGQLGPGGVWVIDLDGVAYDLPIRDLRKLISSTMDDLGRWDIDWMMRMISAYHKACPIDPKVYKVLLIDMSLPNELYKNIKEMVYDPATFLNGETNALLRRLKESDALKWPALKKLENWVVK